MPTITKSLVGLPALVVRALKGTFIEQDGNNTFSGTNTFSGANTFTSTLTATGTTQINTLKVGASGTVGAFNVFPATSARGSIRILAANSAGDTVTTITNASQTGAATYTIPDAGTSSFVMTEGAQTINGTKTIPAIVTTNLDAGASGTAGTIDVFPSTASRGKLAISVTDQTGDTTVSLVVGAMGAARTITLPDPGAAARVLLTTDTSSSTATAATTTEITRIADVSARLVPVGGTSLSVTEASHSDKIILLNHSGAASTCTLPDATGSGAVFRFIVSTVNTNNHVIVVPDASNVFRGSVNILDNDSNAQTAYAASGTDDTLTLNGTTTGGQIGDWVEFVDIAADTWAVRGDLVCPAGSNVADPFSATV